MKNSSDSPSSLILYLTVLGWSRRAQFRGFSMVSGFTGIKHMVLSWIAARTRVERHVAGNWRHGSTSSLYILDINGHESLSIFGDFFHARYSWRRTGSMCLSESPKLAPLSTESLDCLSLQGDEGDGDNSPRLTSDVALWCDWLRCLLGMLGVEVMTKAFNAVTSVSSPSTWKKENEN